ncbi:hypothetical protein pEaSNUABM54_00021 [Erwinia phage pEa_SNUABM_54]|nr:hypothetical protein pEaSNUABM54_00021 [Erwinia phage pEa_SNUABM_54]
MAIDITFRDWLANHVGTKTEPKEPPFELIAIAGPDGATAYYSVEALSLDAVRMSMEHTNAVGYYVPNALPNLPASVVLFVPKVESYLEIKSFLAGNVRTILTTGVVEFDKQIHRLTVNGDFPYLNTFLNRLRAILTSLSATELAKVNKYVDANSVALIDLGNLHDAELYLPLKTRSGVPAWLVVPVDGRWYLAVRYTITGQRVVFTEQNLPGVRLADAIQLIIGD